MTSVVTYANDARGCFCQIKFDSGERILISIAGLPNASVRIMRMAFGGLLPIKTIWEYSLTMAGDPNAYVENIMTMFPPRPGASIAPLDVVRDALLQCSSIDDARRTLTERLEKIAIPRAAPMA